VTGVQTCALPISSDYGYIKFIDNINSASSYTQYNYFNATHNTETAALIIGCENDSNSSGPDSIILNPAGNVAITPKNNITYISGNVGIGTTNPIAKLHIVETTGTVASANAGSIILDHENNGGVSSIIFRSKVNRGSDYGYIQFQDSTSPGAVGELNKLVIGTSDNGDDDVILSPSGSVGIGTYVPLTKLFVNGSFNSSIIYENAIPLTSKYLQYNTPIKSNVIINSIQNIGTVENKYPPKTYTTTTTETSYPYLSSLTSTIQTITLNNYNISYGAGDYIIYSSTTFGSTFSRALLFNNTIASGGEAAFGGNQYSYGDYITVKVIIYNVLQILHLIMVIGLLLNYLFLLY
jgi:hypothetical protein